MSFQSAQNVQNNLSEMSSIQIVQYSWGAYACCKCKDNIKLFKIFNENGEPFLEVIDATDCETMLWGSGNRRKFVCTDTQLLHTFITMKMEWSYERALLKVHLFSAEFFSQCLVFFNRLCILLTNVLEM